jgi:hypothetical protein
MDFASVKGKEVQNRGIEVRSGDAVRFKIKKS